MSDGTVFEPLPLGGLVLVKPRRFADARGYFAETYSRERYARSGIAADFVQDNLSFSARRFTVRGLHFQRPPFAQAKLVQVLSGRVFDVAVDLRRGSPTWGKWVGVELSAEGGEQLFVPRGFAHGYCTLDDDVVLTYKVDAPYRPESEGGVRWDDASLDIDWPEGAGQAVLSPRDLVLPFIDVDAPLFLEEGP